MKFSEEIKKVRKKLNLSQQEMAEKFGISRVTIARWETDKFKPNYEAYEQYKILIKNMPTIKLIEKALTTSYSKQTCAIGYLEKFKENKLAGQSIPTALVVHDYFGGKIMRAEIEGTDESHFYNDVDGEIIDLTKGQFDSDVKYVNISEKTRESFRPIDIQRYRILKGKVKSFLAKKEKQQ